MRHCATHLSIGPTKIPISFRPKCSPAVCLSLTAQHLNQHVACHGLCGSDIFTITFRHHLNGNTRRERKRKESKEWAFHVVFIFGFYVPSGCQTLVWCAMHMGLILILIVVLASARARSCIHTLSYSRSVICLVWWRRHEMGCSFA